MRIVKIFNNNVALVRDAAGRELVVQGRGLAFQTHPGDTLDPKRVERRFFPEPTATPEQLGQQVADIPPELIARSPRRFWRSGRSSGWSWTSAPVWRSPITSRSRCAASPPGSRSTIRSNGRCASSTAARWRWGSMRST